MSEGKVIDKGKEKSIEPGGLAVDTFIPPIASLPKEHVKHKPKDSKAPNFMIRSVVRGKIEKYKSTILTDPNHLLSGAWGLGDCNNASVVLIVGKDKKVKHVQRGEIRGKDIETIVQLIAQLIKEA
jgi:hypothetical protein